MKLVSVIVPVYNARDYIKECLDSILRQTYGHIEVICVDDGSKDGSADVIKEYALTDRRLRYAYKPNGGVSSARNDGLRLAKGEYIQFVDSDDAVSPDMTEHLVKTLEESSAGLVICGYRMMSDQSNVIVPRAGLISEKSNIIDNIPSLYASFLLQSPWNKLYRASYILRKFDESISLGEDLVFNLDYMQVADSVILLDKPLYIYRDNLDGSLTRKYHANAFDTMRIRISSLEKICGERSQETLNALSGNLFEEYMTCLHGEVFDSKSTFTKVISRIRGWNRSVEVGRYIKGEQNHKNLQYLIDHDMIVFLYLYLKAGFLKEGIKKVLSSSERRTRCL